jgi:hypothetical protein
MQLLIYGKYHRLENKLDDTTRMQGANFRTGKLPRANNWVSLTITELCKRG